MPPIPTLPPEPPVPIPPVPSAPKLNEENLQIFCDSIKVHEGYFKGSRSYRNCSPANFRYTELIKNLGATGHDAQNYAIFPSFAIGYKALEEFIKLAAQDKLTKYKQANLLTFFQVYAPSSDNNNYLEYARVVGKALGVPINTRIKDIIYG
jgi:hypothetical protein